MREIEFERVREADLIIDAKYLSGRTGNLSDEVISKLKRYEKLGVDNFIYYASMGLGHQEQKKSLKLFCNEVIPAFKQ